MPETTPLRTDRPATILATLRVLPGISLWLALAGCAPPDPRTPELFLSWRASHEAEVSRFETFLRHAAVDSIVAPHQLLRSAADWQACGAEPFAVPPPPQWASVRSVLELLRELRARDILGEVEIHSGYRNPALNQCAGGAKASAHTLAFALDLSPDGSPRAGERLCDFWRKQGQAWNMGLSRYPSGRIHLDTHGYRRWGHDGAAGNPFCPEETTAP